jgi:hypothetical protein
MSHCNRPHTAQVLDLHVVWIKNHSFASICQSLKIRKLQQENLAVIFNSAMGGTIHSPWVARIPQSLLLKFNGDLADIRSRKFVGNSNDLGHAFFA